MRGSKRLGGITGDIGGPKETQESLKDDHFSGAISSVPRGAA